MSVGGVPPDYFSKTGQLWGNPVYDWDKMKERDFGWLLERISNNLGLLDLLRLDHFRGYVAYWEVPAEETTAINGMWKKTPSESFFDAMKKRFPTLPFFAEDLGVITQDVKKALTDLGIPGTKVLVFAFDGSKDNPYLPFNYDHNSAVYTGTHDTNTVKGWFMNEATAQMKNAASKYIGKKLDEDNVSWEFVRLAMSSTADLCITPAQDLLSLGAEARMNNPSSLENNWQWKLKPGDLTADLFERLRELTEIYGRTSTSSRGVR